jgi:hypothetical protein
MPLLPSSKIRWYGDTRSQVQELRDSFEMLKEKLERHTAEENVIKEKQNDGSVGQLDDKIPPEIVVAVLDDASDNEGMSKDDTFTFDAIHDGRFGQSCKGVNGFRQPSVRSENEAVTCPCLPRPSQDGDVFEEETLPPAAALTCPELARMQPEFAPPLTMKHAKWAGLWSSETTAASACSLNSGPYSCSSDQPFSGRDVDNTLTCPEFPVWTRFATEGLTERVAFNAVSNVRTCPNLPFLTDDCTGLTNSNSGTYHLENHPSGVGGVQCDHHLEGVCHNIPHDRFLHSGSAAEHLPRGDYDRCLWL